MKKLFALAVLVFILISCNQDEKQQKENILNDESPGNSGDTTGTASSDAPKLIKTAALEFKVANAEQSAKQIANLSIGYGGMVMRHHVEARSDRKKELQHGPDSLLVINTVEPIADLIVRVPADSLLSFMFATAEMGYFTRMSDYNVEDAGLRFLEQQLKAKARGSFVSENPKAPRNENFTTPLAITDEAIALTVANKKIDADVKFSVVHFSIDQNTIVTKEVIADYHAENIQTPFFTRLRESLQFGGQLLSNLGLLLLRIWPVLIAGGLVWYLLRQNAKRGLAPTAPQTV